MRSTYSLPTWMIDQVNQKENEQPRTGSKKSPCPDCQKEKKREPEKCYK